jgi:predicted component of type VI protein secretion system
MTKLAQAKVDSRKVQESRGPGLRLKDTMAAPAKMQVNPDYLYFESLKNVFDSATYKIIIKLLHIYTEVE